MKRLFRIFELAKNEQRVVLIVMFVLIAIAFIEYERRIYRHPKPRTPAVEPTASPSPMKIQEGQRNDFRKSRTSWKRCVKCNSET
jgi:hypothetical protein